MELFGFQFSFHIVPKLFGVILYVFCNILLIHGVLAYPSVRQSVQKHGVGGVQLLPQHHRLRRDQEQPTKETELIQLRMEEEDWLLRRQTRQRDYRSS